MNPRMLVEFVDGSKTMVEMSAIANATGLVPDKAGMHGPKAASLDELHKVLCPQSRMAACHAQVGVVDYTVGKGVAPGVFVIAEASHPRISRAHGRPEDRQGPVFHLLPALSPDSAGSAADLRARRALRQADMVPLAKPVAEVCAWPRSDLKPGETLDAIGEYTYRAWIMTAAEARAKNAVPCGLIAGRHGDGAHPQRRAAHLCQCRGPRIRARSSSCAAARTSSVYGVLEHA
jgi:predicted homoserine dehydrogenase-like protein